MATPKIPHYLSLTKADQTRIAATEAQTRAREEREKKFKAAVDKALSAARSRSRSRERRCSIVEERKEGASQVKRFVSVYLTPRKEPSSRARESHHRSKSSHRKEKVSPSPLGTTIPLTGKTPSDSSLGEARRKEMGLLKGGNKESGVVSPRKHLTSQKVENLYKTHYFTTIRLEAVRHKQSLPSYVFLRKFAQEKAKEKLVELSKSTAEALTPQFNRNERTAFYEKMLESLEEELSKSAAEELAPQFDRSEWVAFYKKMLKRLHIEDLAKVGLSEDSPLIDFESCTQAANMLHHLAHCLNRDFQMHFPKSVEKIEYFFYLINNPRWIKGVKHLNLSLETEDPERKDLPGITWVADFFFQQEYIHLESVDLSGNCLSELIEQFLAKSPKLTSLNLSGNPLKTLPWDFGEWWQLTELILRGTEVYPIPEAVIRRCSQLKKFDSSQNPYLIELPKYFARFWPEIEEIDLNNTPLTSFPFQEIFRLKNLQLVNLRETCIKEVPSLPERVTVLMSLRQRLSIS